MVDKGRPLESVGGLACVLHTLGHARRATGEDPNLREVVVLLLQVVKEALEVRTPKVGHCAQASEEGLVGDLLEVALTDVLHREVIQEGTNDRIGTR